MNAARKPCTYTTQSPILPHTQLRQSEVSKHPLLERQLSSVCLHSLVRKRAPGTSISRLCWRHGPRSRRRREPVPVLWRWVVGQERALDVADLCYGRWNHWWWVRGWEELQVGHWLLLLLLLGARTGRCPLRSEVRARTNRRSGSSHTSLLILSIIGSVEVLAEVVPFIAVVICLVCGAHRFVHDTGLSALAADGRRCAEAEGWRLWRGGLLIGEALEVVVVGLLSASAKPEHSAGDQQSSDGCLHVSD